MSRAGAAGFACLLLMSPGARAADWNGSYSADGRCHCSGTIDPRLATRIVPTPRGGHSVARVCERVGEGPGLSFVDGRFDRVVYADPQCGHGPSLADAAAVDPACAGTMEPGGDDCRAIGPRWDLATAYARPPREASAEVAVALIGAGVLGAPAAVPVVAAAVPAPGTVEETPVGKIVEIDGRRWREAPLGTPESGPPGTRIILDDRVYLDVEKASPDAFLPRADRPRRAAASPKPASAPKPKPVLVRKRAPKPVAPPARVATVEPATAATPRIGPGTSAKTRRERLLAEARVRPEPTPAPAPEIAPEPAPEPLLAAARPPVKTSETAEDVAPAVADAAHPTAASGTPEDVESTDADRSAAADEIADAVAPTEAGDAVVSPLMQALRLPPATRASSREFGYVDAMPTSYDYGGGGLMLEGSAALTDRLRALARIGTATDYQELLLGGSWFVTPPEADRLTVVLTAGVETGRFELEGRGVSTDLADTGLYLGAASRLVVNDRFELQAGVGYSSFFEGDPIAFGSGYYHVAPRLDVVSRVEIGDNDSLGIGVRYYYQ